jgi:hypothetical protein
LRRRDSNLCISKSDLLNFTVQTGSWAAGQRLRLFFKSAARALAIGDAQVRVLPPGLRVWVNSDSEMQRFDSCRPSQPVRLQRVTYEVRRSYLRNLTVPRGVKKFACLRTVPSPSRWKKRSPDIWQWRRHSCLLSPRACCIGSRHHQRRLSATTRAPWRSVILAFGHRSHAMR